MKSLMISTMFLGALCILTMNQPAKAEIRQDPNFQLVRGGHHGGGGDGHHHHHHGGGWGWGAGGVGLGIGLGILGTTIYNDAHHNGTVCGYDEYGQRVCSYNH